MHGLGRERVRNQAPATARWAACSCTHDSPPHRHCGKSATRCCTPTAILPLTHGKSSTSGMGRCAGWVPTTCAAARSSALSRRPTTAKPSSTERGGRSAARRRVHGSRRRRSAQGSRSRNTSFRFRRNSSRAALRWKRGGERRSNWGAPAPRNTRRVIRRGLGRPEILGGVIWRGLGRPEILGGVIRRGLGRPEILGGVIRRGSHSHSPGCKHLNVGIPTSRCGRPTP